MLLLLFFCPAWSLGQGMVSESAVKAAFIYNFIKFVEWPANTLPTGHIRLCLVGHDDKLQVAIEQMVGKEAQGRILEIANVQRSDLPGNCQVLVISSNEDRVAEILRMVGEAPKLTISDAADFIDDHGMIGLNSVDHKVQFDINVNSARRAHLKISAQLLKLARRVVQ